MDVTMPEITREFLSHIEKTSQETYTLDVQGLAISVFPYVFPPDSPHSVSSKVLYAECATLRGERVLDVGTGTGILALCATRAGACCDAVDIDSIAVECTRFNANQNGLSIEAWESDMFERVTAEYDCIIANLPFLDLPMSSRPEMSLMDAGWKNHERLFAQSPHHLASRGRILMSHANLHFKSSHERLEELAHQYGFSSEIMSKASFKGYDWRTYSFRRDE